MTDYGLTPAQYHAGLDKLWKALGLTDVQDKDVFTLCAERIGRLTQQNAQLRAQVNQLQQEIESRKCQIMEMARRDSLDLL